MAAAKKEALEDRGWQQAHNKPQGINFGNF
jgi:hypothetical protein